MKTYTRIIIPSFYNQNIWVSILKEEIEAEIVRKNPFTMLADIRKQKVIKALRKYEGWENLQIEEIKEETKMESLEKEMIIDAMDNLKTFIEAIKNDKLDEHSKKEWCIAKLKTIDAVLKTLKG